MSPCRAVDSCRTDEGYLKHGYLKTLTRTSRVMFHSRVTLSDGEGGRQEASGERKGGLNSRLEVQERLSDTPTSLQGDHNV